MSSKEIVIDVRNLSKRYEIYNTPQDRLKQLVFPFLQNVLKRAFKLLGVGKFLQTSNYYREFWALRDVTFQIRRGETFGIIGRNGSGKSTLLQMLAGTLTQTSGEVSVNGNGRIAALLELGSGFNPEFTGRENVLLNGQILGLSQKEIEARYNQIVEFADIGEFIDQPVKTYSSGMFVRLAFAVQAHIDASIVIIDEALAVGDVFFTQKCYSRMRELVDSGVAIVLVTHDMATVSQFCSRVLVLNKGQEMYLGDPISAIRRYMTLQRGGDGSIKQVRVGGDFAVKESLNVGQSGQKWPQADDFFDKKDADVIGSDHVEFIGVCLCNVGGEPSQLFQIGESAIFCIAYRVLEDIGVPVGGVTIINEKGLIVHGKNSMQYQVDAPNFCVKGTLLRFRQTIVLDIAPGDYTFVVGLAEVAEDAYKNCANMTHGDLSHFSKRLISVGRAGTFTVTMCGDGIALKHHGIANLPGDCNLEIITSNNNEKNDVSA